MVLVHPQRHRVGILIVTIGHTGGGDEGYAVALLAAVMMVVAREDQPDVVSAFQTFHVLGQIVNLVLMKC